MNAKNEMFSHIQQQLEELAVNKKRSSDVNHYKDEIRKVTRQYKDAQKKESEIKKENQKLQERIKKLENDLEHQKSKYKDMKHQKQGAEEQALMFKTKHESLQEILATIGPNRQQVQTTEQQDLAELQREHSELMMLGMDARQVECGSEIMMSHMTHQFEQDPQVADSELFSPEIEREKESQSIYSARLQEQTPSSTENLV